MTPIPKWYRPVALLALLWNLLGCFAFLSDMLVTAEDISRMSPAQQTLFASRTGWAVSATAIAVCGGAAGSFALLRRSHWALPLLLASLAGLAVQDAGLLLVPDVWSLAGPVPFLLQGLVLAIAVLLILLARKAASRGWLSRNPLTPE